MKRFGERDTRFPGARQMPEHSEQDHDGGNAGELHFHNCCYEMFQGKAVLSRLLKNLSRKQK